MSEKQSGKQTANQITAEILLKVSADLPQVILWRQNAGMGLPLQYVKQAVACLRRGDIAGAIRALSSRPFRAGVTGTADLSGIGPGGRRVEVEVKTENDRQRIEQARFESMITRHGGFYCIAGSADEAVTKLRDGLDL